MPVAKTENLDKNRLLGAARDRFMEELTNHPLRRYVDGSKRMAVKAGLSTSYLRNVLSGYCPVTITGSEKMIDGLKLDRGYILTGVRTPPAPAPVTDVMPEEPSVRDWFAMSAMNAMMAQGLPPAETAKEYAVTAYICADAMLEARQA